VWKKERSVVSKNFPTTRKEKDFDAFDVLKVQLEEKDKQIALLQEELSQSRDQSNQIIAALTSQNQLMLEDKTSPWYRRWFGKKAKTDNSH